MWVCVKKMDIGRPGKRDARGPFNYISIITVNEVFSILLVLRNAGDNTYLVQACGKSTDA